MMTREQLSELVCFNYYVGWRAIQGYYKRHFPPGMNPPRMYVLSVCDRSKPSTLTRIARTLAMDLPGASQIVERMEADGLLACRRSASSGREVEVRLTPKGERIRERTTRALSAADAGYVDRLPKADARALRRATALLLHPPPPQPTPGR